MFFKSDFYLWRKISRSSDKIFASGFFCWKGVDLNVPFLVLFVSQVPGIQSEISISSGGPKSALFQHFVPFNYHDFIFKSRFLEKNQNLNFKIKNVSPEFSGRFQGFWIIRSELWEIIFWSRIFNSIQGVLLKDWIIYWNSVALGPNNPFKFQPDFFSTFSPAGGLPPTIPPRLPVTLLYTIRRLQMT